MRKVGQHSHASYLILDSADLATLASSGLKTAWRFGSLVMIEIRAFLSSFHSTSIDFKMLPHFAHFQ